MMRTVLVFAASLVVTTCIQAADKPADARAALERKLHGKWQGPACGGNWIFAADGTFEVEHYTPAGHQLTGTWQIRWDALPPTLVRTSKTSDDPELVAKTWDVKLIHLEDDAFSYQSPDQYPRGHLQRFTRIEKRIEKAGAEESRDAPPLRASIHYLDGLSAQSRETPQDIRFLHYGCHLSLLLTNTTKDEMHLWKPNCPEGDDAIRLEFKRDADSKEIGTARTSHLYTGGMGIPKTMKLAPGDSLVHRIDFSSYWSLPFVLKPGAKADLLVRAVYESKPINPKRAALLRDAIPKAEKVWNGRIETEWERVRIANLTESDAPKGHRGINLLQ
jgi:hypothetical protein